MIGGNTCDVLFAFPGFRGLKECEELSAGKFLTLLQFPFGCPDVDGDAIIARLVT